MRRHDGGLSFDRGLRKRGVRLQRIEMSSFNKARVFILYRPRGSLMVDSDTDVAISIVNAREWPTRAIRSHAPTHSPWGAH